MPVPIAFPRVGIRPAIDGRRRGVRESLEAQTMGLAERVAALIESELLYLDGSAVETVIADTTIGGIAEADACARKFADNRVGLTITVTPCWCYGTETMDLDPHMPHAVLGFNGTERPGAVYLAAVLAGYAQKGIPAFGIYGHDVQDADDTNLPDDVRRRVLSFVRAGLAVATMRGTSYLSMGSVAMGIAGSVVKDEFFGEYLGMRNEYVDMSEISRRIDAGIYDNEEYERAIAWVRENCIQGSDRNPEHLRLDTATHAEHWEYVTKMALVGRDLMVGNPKLAEMGFAEEAQGHNALAAGFQGQRQWTDGKPNGDFLETILNSSFDWDGPRRPHILGTENDSLNATSMLLGHLVTGGLAQIFSDVRTYWSPESVKRVTGHELEGRASNGILHLINSGSTALDGTGRSRRTSGGSGEMHDHDPANTPVIKPFWEMTQDDVSACLKATVFHPASREYFPGGGFSTHFVTEGGMPVTMTRINLVRGLGPVLQLAEGWTVSLPDEIHNVLDQRTDPTWPTTWFAPRLTGTGAFVSVYDVMNAWGANHAAISYGHIGADLITLASMLRIPVNMHNVSPEMLVRPKAWSSFGTSDPEGADYRACATYGPLYG